MEKDLSIARTKKTTVSIAELLGKEAMAAIIPGGGMIYDSTKALVNHGRKYFSDRTEMRMEQFYAALLSDGADEESFLAFLEKPFDLDDYYALLTSCAQDIENEKVEIYSTLMRSLLNSKISAEMKRHFIKSCNDLTYSEIQFLRKLYINCKHDLMTVGGAKEQVQNMLSSAEPLVMLTIENLKSIGFIDTRATNLSSMAEMFVSMIFQAKNLAPESIGRKPFTGINILIAAFSLETPAHTKIAADIHEALWDNQIKSSIQSIRTSNITQAVMSFDVGILLVDEKELDAETIEVLSKFSGKRPIVRLNSSQEYSGQTFPDIAFSDEITLTSTDSRTIRDQISEYVSSRIV